MSQISLKERIHKWVSFIREDDPDTVVTKNFRHFMFMVTYCIRGSSINLFPAHLYHHSELVEHLNSFCTLFGFNWSVQVSPEQRLFTAVIELSPSTTALMGQGPNPGICVAGVVSQALDLLVYPEAEELGYMPSDLFPKIWDKQHYKVYIGQPDYLSRASVLVPEKHYDLPDVEFNRSELEALRGLVTHHLMSDRRFLKFLINYIQSLSPEQRNVARTVLANLFSIFITLQDNDNMEW